MACGEATEMEILQDICQAEEEAQERPIAPPVDERRQKPRPTNHGGYDCEFVQSPPTALQTDCSICLQVLRSPHLANCCGQNFCKECIERVQKDGKPCPLCNEQQFNLTHNRSHETSLNSFEVYCTHRKLGCEWKGMLELLETHLNIEPKIEKQLEGCGCVEVLCFNDDCGKIFQRRYLPEHQFKNCPQRIFSCEHCHKYESTYHDVATNHWPVCACYPVPCPNQCTQNLQRQNLQKHLDEDCPLQEVKCEFMYAGCQTKLPRKDMPEHLKENVGHMTLLARQNQELTAKLLEKDETIRRMIEENKREMEETQRKVQEIERLLLNQQEKLNHKEKQIEKLKKEHKSSQQLECEMTEQIEILKKETKKQIERYSTSTKKLGSRVEGLEQKQDGTKMKMEEKFGDLLTQLNEARRSLHELQRRTLTAPVEIVMPDFEHHSWNRKIWYSEDFYTHPWGYKMCLCVDANGNRGTHVSIFVYLVRGECDDSLKWPFHGRITVTILNQREDTQHCVCTIVFDYLTPRSSAGRVVFGKRAHRGWGELRSISLSELRNNSANRKYIMNDCLHFRVTAEVSPW